MGLIGNLEFWLAAAVLAVAMQLIPAMPRGRWFGLLNLGVLLVAVGPAATFAAVVASLCVWVLGLGCRQPRMRIGYAGGVIGILTLLVLYKLSRAQAIPGCAGTTDCAGTIALGILAALSFSYVALRGLDYLRAQSDGEPGMEPLTLLGYLFPFHMLTAGPIAAYRDFLTINEAPPTPATFRHLLAAANLIATGLVYKLVIAEGLRIFVSGVAPQPIPDAWWSGSYLFVYLFFDFAGYSLIALGIGRLCGVPTPINFDKPFLSTSVTEFWTRWHMSLGSFVRTNIYMPLQIALVRRFGVRRSAVIAFFTTSVSFTFVGLWHQLTPRFLLWGLALGLVMGIEKLVRDRLWVRFRSHASGTAVLGRILGPIYVFVVISASLHWVAQEVS